MYGAPIPVVDYSNQSDIRTAIMASAKQRREREARIAASVQAQHERDTSPKFQTRLTRQAGARLERLDRIQKHASGETRAVSVAPEPQMPGFRDIIDVATPEMSIEGRELQEQSIYIRARFSARDYAFKIIRWVAKRYRFYPEQLLADRRRADIVRARHLAIQIIAHSRKCQILSIAQIGRYFGNRDHTTILNAACKAPSFRARRPSKPIKERACMSGREFWSAKS